MPMQPRPIADTIGPLRPSRRIFIVLSPSNLEPCELLRADGHQNMSALPCQMRVSEASSRAKITGLSCKICRPAAALPVWQRTAYSLIVRASPPPHPHRPFHAALSVRLHHPP